MSDEVSSTAYGPMFMIASEQKSPDGLRIIDDALAYKILPFYLKVMVTVCNLKPFRQAFYNLLEKRGRGIPAVMICRKRYIEDKVCDSLKTGIDTLVILGAGMDTLAYRRPELSSVRVYELDLPINILYKQKKLESLFGSVPANVTLAPINFQDQNLENVLTQHGYSFTQRTFFVWEAVTQYLTQAAVRNAFQFFGKAKLGSRLIFTYVLKDFIDGQNKYGLDSLYQQYLGKIPLWLFGLYPRDVASFTGEYSWKILEHIGYQEVSERYLRPVGRNEPVAAIERIVFAEKT